VGFCFPSHKYGRCSGFWVLQRYNEFELQKVVANIGPVAVGINANNSTFYHYKTVGSSRLNQMICEQF
ncbi:cathepsin S-like, partial [Tachysurus ichikawai]